MIQSTAGKGFQGSRRGDTKDNVRRKDESDDKQLGTAQGGADMREL
jgi:hypothetical protein